MTRIARQRPTVAAGPLHDVRVGVYVRRSTDDEHQPYSIQAQDTRLAAYIGSQPGWRQAVRFADDASGATTDRPGLQRALAAAQAGAIDVLLVYRVDRLTRSLRDLVTLLDDLDRAGVVFRSATEPFDTATAMGRMLVQMLGMFAQFFVISNATPSSTGSSPGWNARPPPGNGKAAAARSVTSTTPLPARSYPTRARPSSSGSSSSPTFATGSAAGPSRTLLNDRGHRTTTGGTWSSHQVVRVLSNRVYLGVLTFRDVTTAGCHPAIIDQAVFSEAETILAARGEDYSKRAANSSDYLLTGLMRCPSCGKVMIGTRAHGRSRVYRYYTCFTRLRYDTKRCDAARLDADAAEQAVLGALASFYRDQHDLIADAIAQAQASHAAGHLARHAELAAAERELAKTSAAIDRYLTAFENGSLDPEDLVPRLAQLRTRSAQLRACRDELAAQTAATPTAPPAATLRQVAGHIDDIIRSGTENQRKALVESLVAQIKIIGPDGIVPIFRIPRPSGTDHDGGLQPPDEHNPQGTDAVRAMTNLVGATGFEPVTPRL